MAELKSAVELAMERLRRRDEEAGTTDAPLTGSQRNAIAEARNVCEARTAEVKILYQSKIAGLADPAARQQLEDEYRRDLQRITDERDRKIDRIRKEPS